tara:strand:+ start:425 stop:1651 length:1227 start_codon:yes stop_codon:yes gene_type:complete
MRIAVITVGCSGSSELISILNKMKLNVINKPFNHLYPNELLFKFGKNIKVIFITRSIKEILVSLKNRELDKGINWIKQHYKHLNSDFTKYPKLFVEDTLNFEKLYDSYKNTNIFPVLFIKYESLYFEDNIKTINMLNYFLNCNLEPNNFKFNNNNKWTSLKKIILTNEEIGQISKTFLSLENKINIYNTQLIVPPLNLINKIKLLKSNKHYRFGDVIMHSGHYWKESTKHILENKEFEDSILRHYIEACPDKNLNNTNPEYAKLLLNIVKKKIKENKYILPKNNELVIHLRLGDVVFNRRFLQKNYKKIIESYVKKHNVVKVTFCTAFHYGNYIERNLWIYDDDKHQKNISKLSKKLNSIMKIPNIYIDFISSKNPDDDFIYMVNSKYFVKDFGGFSKLILYLHNESF